MSDDERNENQRRRRLSEANDDGPDNIARRRKVAEASQRDTKRGLCARSTNSFAPTTRRSCSAPPLLASACC